MNRFFLLLLIFPIAIHQAWAQSGSENQPGIDLEPIVITATLFPTTVGDLPQEMFIVPQPELTDSGTINDSLRLLPGVEVRSTGPGGAATVSIHGSEYGQILGLYRGLPLNSPLAGGLDWSSLPFLPGELKNLEIIAGPAAVPYGTDAMGGVINLVPADLPPSPVWTINLGLGAGNAKEASVAGASGASPLGWKLGAGTFSGDQNRSHSRFETVTAAGLGSLSIGDSYRLTFETRYLEKTTQVPGPEEYPSPNAEQWDQKTWFLADFGPADLSKDGFRAALLAKREKIEYRDPDMGEDSHNQFDTITGRAWYRWLPTFPLDLAAGIETEMVEAEGTDIEKTSESKAALFSILSYQASPALTITGGGRADFPDDYDNQFSPQAGAVFLIRDGLWATARIARSFRAPTVNERYYSGPWGQGNPDLSPETGWEYQTGIRWRRSNLSGQAVLYRRDVDDLIAWRDDDGDWIWEPVNLSSARLQGFDLDTTFEPAQKTSLRLGYSFLDPVDTSDGSIIPGKPRHKLSAVVSYRPDRLTDLSLGVRSVGFYPDNNGEERAFSVVRISVARDLRLFLTPARLTLAVDNVLDEGYEEAPGYPMPGRRISGRLEITL